MALYRPGPMANIPTLCQRKDGEERASRLHPTLEPILTETYGIIVYQEQVMQIAQDLAGYSLGGADLLRRAMGKKIRPEMDAAARDASSRRGRTRRRTAKAGEIFDLMDKFADYGFNKSHAAAYALVSYQTAWLKANHTVDFLAASMTLDIDNTEKLAGHMQECAAARHPGAAARHQPLRRRLPGGDDGGGQAGHPLRPGRGEAGRRGGDGGAGGSP